MVPDPAAKHCMKLLLTMLQPLGPFATRNKEGHKERLGGGRGGE